LVLLYEMYYDARSHERQILGTVIYYLFSTRQKLQRIFTWLYYFDFIHYAKIYNE